MTNSKLLLLSAAVLGGSLTAHAQMADPCANLATLKIDGTEITKAVLVPAGTTVPPPYPGAQGIGPLPAHCRVDGVINRRKGGSGYGNGPRGHHTRGEFVQRTVEALLAADMLRGRRVE